MLKWINQFREAKPQTKYFILIWFIFGMGLLLSTVYSYARIERSRENVDIQMQLDSKGTR
jgi:hypothetical protein